LRSDSRQVMMSMNIIAMPTDEEPQVVNIAIENIRYITENRILTSAEAGFLMELIVLVEPGNRLQTTSVREIARRLKRSERRTRDLLQSLLRKSVLFEGKVRKGIFIHPEILVVGSPENVPLWLAEEVMNLRRRNQVPKWPLVLMPGRRRGVWRWKN